MMCACLRTAGCPAAERNLRTRPIAGASPAFAAEAAEAPIAQPRCPREGDRAVFLKRRRLVRDDFLGVKGNLHSHCPGRASGRPSIDVWCTLLARLTPVCRRIRLHPFAERQAAVGREKNWRNSVTSEVRPLDFGDHIEVRPDTCLPRVHRKLTARYASKRLCKGIPPCSRLDQDFTHASSNQSITFPRVASACQHHDWDTAL